MNRRARFVTLLLPGLAIALGPAGAAEPAKAAGKKITVTGSATVTLKPDAARLVFGVTTTMPDVKGARAENEKHVKRVLESLSALAFKDVDIQTVPGSVNSMQMNDPAAAAGPAVSKQVQTVITLTVREKDPDKLRGMAVRLSDTVVENGGAAVGSDDYSPFPGRLARMGRVMPEVNQGPPIEWLTQEMGDIRRDVIKKAVRDAQANAQAALPEAKLEVAEVTVTIGEYATLRQRVRGNPYGYVPDSGPNSLTVEVQVTFTY
jgi:uncharacterized protein YggE